MMLFLFLGGIMETNKVISIFFRLVIVMIGTAIAGFGVYLMLVANKGMDPFSTLVDGVNQYVPMKFGTLCQVFNIFYLIISFLLDKKNIGVATIIYGIGCGFFINVFSDLQLGFLVHIPPYLSLVLGVFLLGVGIAIYLSAKLGAGPVEGVMVFLTKFLKWDVHYVRIMLDVFNVVVGILLGGIWGFGTVIAAFGTGPAISAGFKIVHFFNRPKLEVKSS